MVCIDYPAICENPESALRRHRSLPFLSFSQIGQSLRPVLALLEFPFEHPVAIPGAGDRKRYTEFKEDSGKPAAGAIKMTRRTRVTIVGEAEIVLRMVQRPVVVQ